ncbi:unnamed protein product [Darwinula stevensoni]|uniref:Peptidase S1 domain-containing protein n=1 Tax=Darwinula stevensoni TaxID=69355 RepID=A0A7R8XEH6_9CRUS|nr:unnamed protein product [Darwinula stevensoni]CAG0895321.1 unnamed protein product [Darwinula stevensoni]
MAFMSPWERRPFRRGLWYKFGIIGYVSKQKTSIDSAFHIAGGMDPSPFSVCFLFLVFSASSQGEENGDSMNIPLMLVFENDIALLRLQTPVNFAAYPNIRPICLAGFYPSPYSVVTIAGWGRPSQSSNAPSNVLMETAVYVMSLQTCQSIWGPQLNNNFVCVKTAGRNTCQGDSGGSLMYRTSKGVYATVGITSYGRDNCSPDVGSVFTSTSSFVNNFIFPNTQDAQWCSIP